MSSVLHRDFTLKNMITPAVLDAQMNLTLLHIYNECPRLYSIFVSFWRHATILPRKRIIFYTTGSLVSSYKRLQYGIVVLGFLDAFVYAHHKHRHDSENSGNFGECMKGRIRFFDGHHSCPRPRPHVPGNVSCTTTTSGCPNPNPDIRIFPMLVP